MSASLLHDPSSMVQTISLLVILLTISLAAHIYRWFFAGSSLPISPASSSSSSPSSSPSSSSAPSLSSRAHLKMVLLVRADLSMGKGKMCAQACHAAVGVVSEILMTPSSSSSSSLHLSYLKRWENQGAMKIALKVNSEEELIDYEKQARLRSLPHCLIRDAGHTQVAPNTRTVLAIGPAPDEVINEITGTLKLL